MDEFVFDASSMESLNRDLLEAATEMHVQTDIAMPEIGAMLAAKADEIVKPHSKSIKVSDRSVPGLAIVQGEAPNSPLGRLYELGKEPGPQDRQRATFSHPVFEQGDSSSAPWVDQVRFPYLRPAARALRVVINARMVKALEDGVKPIFRR